MKRSPIFETVPQLTAAYLECLQPTSNAYSARLLLGPQFALSLESPSHFGRYLIRIVVTDDFGCPIGERLRNPLHVGSVEIA